MSLPCPCHHTAQGPADEVDALFTKAQEIDTMNPKINAVYTKHRELLLEVLDRQVQLLKARSQALEDAHVTVYDKVLLRLTNNGNDLDNPAAITWYCTEYFGFDLAGDGHQSTLAVEQGLALPVALLKADQTSSTNCAASSPVFTLENMKEISINDNDPNLTRLWTTYKKARDDYLKIADLRDYRTLDAARFLRDTAENGIHYLSGKPDADESVLMQFKNTFNLASRTTEKLARGKKRKFDHATDMHQYGRPSRRPTYVDPRPEQKPSYDSRPIRRDSGEGFDCGPSRRGKSRGRGPSGIPYGYSAYRSVDSYHPGNHEHEEYYP